MEVFPAIVGVFDSLQQELLSLFFTCIAAVIFWLFRARVKLIYGKANNSLNQIKVPAQVEGEPPLPTEIYVEKFFLQNAGKRTATNVEFVLSEFPTDISVFQPRKVDYLRLDKGQCLIQIPQIAPQELVVIDCAYINQKAAWISSVKCAETIGREVNFWTVRRYANWVNLSVIPLMLLGFAFILQLLFQVV